MAHKDPEERRCYQASYRRSIAGREARRRYRTSPKGRAAERESQKSREMTPKRRKAAIQWRLTTAYGITLEQRDQMLIDQAGRCAICADPMTSPCLDHDHACCPGPRACGKCVRGLLCQSCNTVLGRSKDLPHVLEAAAVYLREASARRNAYVLVHKRHEP